MSGSGPVSSQYETLYGVQLLDDLHNYFPAVLYDSSRFRTVGDLLFYLQNNARNRFDLFSFGQRNYLQNVLPPAPAAHRTTDVSGIPIRPQAQAQVRSTPILDPFRDIGLTTTARVEMVTEDDDIEIPSMNLMNLMNALAGLPPLRRAATNPSFMEPVVVAPTPEQIRENTEIVTLTEPGTCSICQDTIQTTDTVRRLIHCRHDFHKTCIDPWFHRNVHCPVCRHDIRETDDTTSTRPNSVQ